MPTGAEIVAQLNEAHESESPTDEEQEATEKTETAEAPQTPPVESSSTTGTEEPEKGKEKPTQEIPYDRFKQKVDQVNDLTGKLEKILGDQETSTARENDLRQKVQGLEEDADVLDRLRQLAEHPKYKPLVETLDKALKEGVEDVETGAKTEEEATQDVTKLFEKHQKQLDTAFADQRADMLMEQTRMISDSILESLPEEYDDGDKAMVGGLLSQSVEWEKIDKDPSTMKHHITEGYKRALTKYGEPRGALKAKLDAFETTPEKSVDTAPSDEEYIKGILDDDKLGQMRTDADGKVLGPEMSDAEVEAKMVEIMRRTA